MSSAITAVVVKGAIDKRGADKAQHARDYAFAGMTAREKAAEKQQRADFAPYRQAGGKALTRLEALIHGETDISDTAGYQFRLSEGYKGLEASQAGRRLGGRAAKEAMRYGQGMASQEYGAEFNRLKSMADMGTAAAAKTASLSAGTTARLGASQLDYGETRAGLEMDKSQALKRGLSSAWDAYNAPSSGYDAQSDIDEFGFDAGD